MTQHPSAKFYVDGNASNYASSGDLSSLQSAVNNHYGDLQKAQSDIRNLSANKANSSDVYSKTQVDTAVSGVQGLIPDISGLALSTDVYSKTDADAKYALSSDLSSLTTTVSGKATVASVSALHDSLQNNYYTSAQMNTTLQDYASASSVVDVQNYIVLLRNLCDALKNAIEITGFDWTGLGN